MPQTVPLRPLNSMTNEELNRFVTNVINHPKHDAKAVYKAMGFDIKSGLIAPDEPPRKEERTYLITLTQPDIDKSWDRLLVATQRILNSKQVNPIEWAYCLELTKKDTPHVHIRLRTSKYVEKRVMEAFNDDFIVHVLLERTGSQDYISDLKKAHPPGQWFFCSENYSGPKV